MKCKNQNGLFQNVTFLYIKRAWVAASTVCSQRLFKPTRAAAEVEDVVPTVTTDETEPQYQLNLKVYGTITDEGSSSVTEYGWVWSYSENPTIEDEKVIVGTESFTGAFSQSSGPGSMEPFSPFTFELMPRIVLALVTASNLRARPVCVLLRAH